MPSYLSLKASSRRLFLIAALCGASLAQAADTGALQLKAVLSLGADKLFSLSTNGGTHSEWVKLGDEYQGYKLTKFSEADSTLTLTKDAKESTLRLATAAIKDAPVSKATVADAQAVLDKMHFGELIVKMLDQSWNAQAGAMVKQMSQQIAQKTGSQVSAEDAAEFQKKVADVFKNAVDTTALRASVANIYSDVFTKEELSGLGEFYSSPVGQSMLEKQPQVQQKMIETMMSQMSEVRPKVRDLAVEFQKEQSAKLAPAKPPGT